MYKGKQILGIIPARGGSKGIHRKNLVDLGGHPLIAWTILRAKKSKYIDRLILSSEDDEIIQIAKKYGCEVPFKRPKYLATDLSSSVDVTLHALNKMNYNTFDKYFVLLQPTSPFRKTKTIDQAIQFTLDNDFPYVMSVQRIDKSPYHMYLEKGKYLLEPLYDENKYTRRQDLPKTFVSNGALYIANAEYFFREKSYKPDTIHYYEMSKNESIDIDNYEQLSCAQSFVKTKKEKFM